MIGILSDAHGNGAAFELGIKILKRFGAQKFYFIGDSVGYLPTLEVVHAIRRMGDEILCIKGNHEHMLLSSVTDDVKDEIYKLSQVRVMMGQEDQNMLSSWPKYRELHISGRSILFVHGSPDDHLNGYLYPDSDLTRFKLDYDLVFMGHSHHPFIRTEASTQYCNVGSCGLPRDDGRYGSVGLLNEFSGEVEILRLNIEIETESVISVCGDIHPSVKNLYKRQNGKIYGTLV